MKYLVDSSYATSANDVAV